MRSHAVLVRARHVVRRSAILQVGLLLLFWQAGEGIVELTAMPVPGGVVGMALLLALLSADRLGVGNVQRGARWLIGDMLLFFVPAVLAVLQHRELLGVLGLKLLAIILVGTALVMAATALTVEACLRSPRTRG